MKWAMLLCAAPIVIFLFTQRGRGASGLTWLLVGGCIVAHIIMMSKGHCGRAGADTKDKSDADTAKQLETKIEHDNKRGGCCH